MLILLITVEALLPWNIKNLIFLNRDSTRSIECVLLMLISMQAIADCYHEEQAYILGFLHCGTNGYWHPK